MKKSAELTKRRPGRPSKNKRGTFKFRVTDSLRTKIEAAAKASNRSVSEEIEHRLGQSIAVDFLDHVLSGKNVTLLKLITADLTSLYQQAYPWHEDPESALRLVDKIQQLMNAVSQTNSLMEALDALHPIGVDTRDGGKVGMLYSRAEEGKK